MFVVLISLSKLAGIKLWLRDMSLIPQNMSLVGFLLFLSNIGCNCARLICVSVCECVYAACLSIVLERARNDKCVWNRRVCGGECELVEATVCARRAQ